MNPENALFIRLKTYPSTFPLHNYVTLLPPTLQQFIHPLFNLPFIAVDPLTYPFQHPPFSSRIPSTLLFCPSPVQTLPTTPFNFFPHLFFLSPYYYFHCPPPTSFSISLFPFPILFFYQHFKHLPYVLFFSTLVIVVATPPASSLSAFSTSFHTIAADPMLFNAAPTPFWLSLQPTVNPTFFFPFTLFPPQHTSISANAPFSVNTHIYRATPPTLLPPPSLHCPFLSSTVLFNIFRSPSFPLPFPLLPPPPPTSFPHYFFSLPLAHLPQPESKSLSFTLHSSSAPRPKSHPIPPLPPPTLITPAYTTLQHPCHTVLPLPLSHLPLPSPLTSTPFPFTLMIITLAFTLFQHLLDQIFSSTFYTLASTLLFPTHFFFFLPSTILSTPRPTSSPITPPTVRIVKRNIPLRSSLARPDQMTS